MLIDKSKGHEDLSSPCARAREREIPVRGEDKFLLCFGLFEFVFFLSVEDGKNSCSIDY